MLIMAKPILTTTETAQLLGISVRTAQLMIEGGALPSWKTPGGHRRVYRDDVLSLLAQKDRKPVQSQRVVLISPAESADELASAITSVPGCSLDVYPNIYSALLDIGLHVPAVVVFAVTSQTEDYAELLRMMAANSELAAVKVIIVDERNGAALTRPGNHRVTVTKPEGLAGTIRTMLRDKSDFVIMLDGERSFPIAPDESRRLAALQRSGLVDSAPEEVFDRLTWLAGQTLHAPFALFTTLTSDRQWFKSKRGLDINETPRDWAFCNYTILQRGVFAVEDLTLDKRFADNPAVRNDPRFSFYAGAPVLDSDGFALGSLCVMDTKPRTLTRDETEILRSLAYVTSEAVQNRKPKSRPRPV